MIKYKSKKFFKVGGGHMKRFACGMVVTLLACTLALSGCGEGANEKSEIERLTAQMQELNREIDLLKERAKNAEGELEDYGKQLQELTAQNEVLMETCDNLMGKEIEYTEDMPMYELDLEDVRKEGNIASFDNMRCGEEEDSFELFLEYYQKEIKGNRNLSYSILDPGNREKGWLPHLRRKAFDFYKKGDDFLVNEYMMIYSEALGYPFGGNLDYEGGTECSFVLNLYLAPIPDEILKSEYQIGIGIKFGKIEEPKTVYEQYMNLYLNDTCVGTCYFHTRSNYISATWFEKFFIKNLLIRG